MKLALRLSSSLLFALASAASAEQIVLTAEQSIGGLPVTFASGAVAVTLDKTSTPPSDRGVGIEWKTPLHAGWWHGTLDLAPREGDERGWVNTHLGIALISAQKPSVNMMTNLAFRDKAFDEQHFSFWLYSAGPAEGVRLHSVYDDLYKYKRTWPVLRLTMEAQDAPALTEQDPMTLDLAIGPDGAVALPGALPQGVWDARAPMTKEGTLLATGGDGRTVKAPFDFDRWHRPESMHFYLSSPLKSVRFETAAMFKTVVLEHTVNRPPSTPAQADGELMKTVDPAKPETAELVLIGKDIKPEAPTFPLVPLGNKIAVLTTWDDGQLTDLRCAEILHKHGYRPSFFVNQNSAVMKMLDRLEALDAEVGSHGFHHSTFYAIEPAQALADCVAQRKVLEAQLHHPVISFAYPNGYAAAYDTEGDYVLRAVKAAGYWSGRTTQAYPLTIDTMGDLAAMKSNGFFGNAKNLESDWAETKDKDGGVFYFWGHSWQIGHTDEQWQTFDDFVAKFAHAPGAWYANQGEFSLWLWARQNVRVTVGAATVGRVTVKLTRPWLHPYLAERCPLSLNVPAGVEKVMWQGRDVPVQGGRVDLQWNAEAAAGGAK